MVDESPFTDIQIAEDGFSIPELKWRELLFVGALRPLGGLFVRDPSRPLPPFAVPDLFPVDQPFDVAVREGRAHFRPAAGPP